jgi:hypothetical protein
MSDDSKDKGQNIKVCVQVCVCARGNTRVTTCMLSAQVVLRCRPMTQVEASKDKPAIKCVSDKHVEVNYGALGKASKKSFCFDGVYDEKSTQKEVYESVVRPVVDEVLQGYNCTVFAYGQTGTGKTHTMEGDVSQAPAGVMQPNAGVIPRAVTQVFGYICSYILYIYVCIYKLETHVCVHILTPTPPPHSPAHSYIYISGFQVP